MEPRQIWSAYDQQPRKPLIIKGESRTKQEFKDECDINNIIKRFDKTGVLEHVQENEGYYTETGELDFQAAQDIIATGNSMFEGLPSIIRKRFDNKPEKFLGFMENEENMAEAVKLGLIKAPTSNEASPKAPQEPEKERSGVIPPEDSAISVSREGGKKKIDD